MGVKRVFISVFVLLIISSLYAKNKIDLSAYDLAPGIVPGKLTSAPSDSMWEFQFNYDVEGLTGDNGCVGVCWDGNYIWISGRGVSPNPNMIYIISRDGSQLVNQFPATPSAWGVRDMSADGRYIYGGWESGLIKFDPSPLPANPATIVSTIPFPASQQFGRANAFDPAGNNGQGSFYCGNISSPMYEMDTNGNLLRQFGPGPTVYGMAWDDDDPDGPFLWIHSQDGGCTMRQYDPTTMNPTGVVVDITNQIVPGAIAGGCEYVRGWDPHYSTMMALGQGTPDKIAGFEMHLQANPHAPGAPANFNVAHNQAVLQADLSWTNPTVMVNGNPLTDLDSARVYRDDQLLTTLTNVQIGQPSYYIDNAVPAAGLYSFRVVCYNDSGDGYPALMSAYIGLDVPDAPSNVTVTPDPGGWYRCLIEWTAPTEGAHGGYWPPGSWEGQKVYRDGSEVADLTGSNTRFVDNLVQPGWYYYHVSYYNASGEGPMGQAVPAPVYVGPLYVFPIPYDWVEINTVGTNTGITGDDQNLGPFPIGFDFPWFDAQIFDQIRICSNGFLSFTSTSTAYTNDPIPNPAEPNNLIAPYWDDLNPSAGGNIWYYYDAFNSRFIVEYDGIPHYGGSQPYRFEAILYPTGLIDFQYNTLGETLNSCTVGSENGTGSFGIQATYNGSGPMEPQPLTGIQVHQPWPRIPELVVTLTPHNPPVWIPPGGGQFVFDAQIESICREPQVFDGWTEVVLPSGSMFGPLVLRSSITIAPGQTIMRIVTQTVPGAAPPGNYTYVGNVGTYPGTVIDDDAFPFIKLPGEAAPNHNQGWAVSGWFGDDAPLPAADDYATLSAAPNPFNPVTALSYKLQAASNVKLVVFDISGREVAVLADGFYPAGHHSMFFDGSELASGVYFARLQTGGDNFTRKLLLIK